MGTILLLNADYTPLNTIGLKKACKMIYKNKAQVITTDETRSIHTDFKLPTVVRLNNYVTIPFTKIVLSRQNVFRRDNNICAYCGITCSNSKLTVDHIIPKSRGGQNSWENLVTCCFKCNNAKDDRTPAEAGLKLLYKPFKPNYITFLLKGSNRPDWKPYLFAS